MSDPIVDEPLETLIAEFARSGMRELHVRTDGFELYLSNDETVQGSYAPPLVTTTKVARSIAKQPLAPPSEAPFQATSIADLPKDAVIVRAPNLGTFYRSPKPGAPVYVEVGSLVAPETELCLVEVMKLFTSVTAGAAGRIHAVLATDGEMVEAGQPLFAIARI